MIIDYNADVRSIGISGLWGISIVLLNFWLNIRINSENGRDVFLYYNQYNIVPITNSELYLYHTLFINLIHTINYIYTTGTITLPLIIPCAALLST